MTGQQKVFNSISEVLEAVDAASDQLVSLLHQRFPGSEQYMSVQQEGAWTIWNEIKLDYSNMDLFGRNFEYVLFMMLGDLFGQPDEIEERYNWSPSKNQKKDDLSSRTVSTYTYRRDGLETTLQLNWQQSSAIINIAEYENDTD